MPTFIDLFCGCGGFTLGLQRAGFECVAAIDFEPVAVRTLRENLAGVPYVLQKDLTQFHAQDLAHLAKVNHVDVIVGGPPCQGFSIARQVDGANHGRRLTHDPRRHLYLEFLKYVDYFQPSVFVIENVMGLRSAAGGEYLTRVQHDARVLGRKEGRPGYRVHGQVEDAWSLGVPQKRRRQLIIGIRADLSGFLPPTSEPAPRAMLGTTLGDAIGDLPVLRSGSGEDSRPYDLKRRAAHVRKCGDRARNYLFHVSEVERAPLLTNHVARPHSDRDLRDFALLREGENSAVAMRVRGVEFEFPYDKTVFKDRYTRQSRRGRCSTIVAHLGKDGLMFIHPTQNRSLTPREAARVQSFPDWFHFRSARTHAFRLIGNAVPPLVAEAVGISVKRFLDSQCTKRDERGDDGSTAGMPAISRGASWTENAVRELERLAALDGKVLRSLPRPDFLKAWWSLLTLFPDLHPVNALDHGKQVRPWSRAAPIPKRSLLYRKGRYARSGWPVALEQVGREAWRRHRSGQLAVHELYSRPPVTGTQGFQQER